MDEQATCRLYALALSLVPEPNIAGDIFLFTRSEADLRRRAAAWRRRQGLPDPAGDPPLPPLDADQRELALLLARRGRRQRRLRPWLAAAAAGTLALVLLATLLRPAVAAQGDDRLVGRSTFAVANPDWSLATVSLQAGQGRRWELPVPVTLAGSDPAARRFSVGRIYRYGEYVVSVDAIDVAANYTALHYAVTAPAGTRTAVFEPLRAGAKRLQVAFPMPAPEPVAPLPRFTLDLEQ